MWAKIIEALMVYVIRPLIVDGSKALFKIAKKWNTERKRKKESKKKGEAHKNAKTKADHQDTFNKLP